MFLRSRGYRVPATKKTTSVHNDDLTWMPCSIKGERDSASSRVFRCVSSSHTNKCSEDASMLVRFFSQKIGALSTIVVLAFATFPNGGAFAQVTGATLSGTVTDATGAVIPGVMVSIKNTA